MNIDDLRPVKPLGWKTGKELETQLGGRNRGSQLLRLRDELIGDIVAAGHDASFAEAVVERFLVGQVRGQPHILRRTVTAASPDALRQIERPSRERPSGWRTLSELAKPLPISESALTGRVRKVVARLVEEMVAAGVDEATARAVLDANLCGPRSDPQSGQTSLALSPSLVEMLARDKVFEPGRAR